MRGLGLTTALTVPLAAQRAGDLRLAPVAAAPPALVVADTQRVPLPPDLSEIDVGRGVAGGILGGALGGLAGYGVALLIVENKQNSCGGKDFCGLAEGLLSVVVGESIGLAVGTHHGSRGRGSLIGGSLASIGVGVAGSILGALAGGLPILLVPVAQIATVLLLEHP